MRAAAWVAAALLCAACGKSRSTVAAKDAAPAAIAAGAVDAAAEPAEPEEWPAPIAAEPATWARRPEPSLRALQAALEALDSRAADEWLRERALPRPEDVPPPEPPADVRAALDALVAWDGSGALAPIACNHGMSDLRPHRLLVVAKAARELSAGTMDPPVHATLRMAQALRHEQNDPLAMLVGAKIAEHVAETVAVPPSMQATADLPWLVVRSNARCVERALDRIVPGGKDAAELEQALAQLGWSGPDGIANEKKMVREFWAETMTQVDGARTRAELARVLDARVEAARTSRGKALMLPILGPPYAARTLLRDDE